MANTSQTNLSHSLLDAHMELKRLWEIENRARAVAVFGWGPITTRGYHLRRTECMRKLRIALGMKVTD